MSFASRYATCAGYEIHYMDWGSADAPAVIAWHGLARTGRDMDDLAEYLAGQGFRVVCPDTLGRGLSQWSKAPDEEYCLAFYVRLAQELLDQLRLKQVRWIGTSMGGAIGLAAAAGALAGRITHLALNDIAPVLNPAAIARIRAYAGQPPAFDTVSGLEAFFRQVYAPYGWLSEVQWRRLTESSTRRLPDGRVTPHYDPAMVRQFVVHEHDYDQWAAWDGLQIPVLCLRGVDSDLVLPETITAMRQRGPGARGLLQVIEVPGCGHAPALNVPRQFDWIEAFFRR
ncbi:MAG: alpha/beta hydrolase [Burkholderiales bacterium 66-5]|uniref:alpha/beta fold hydrolase n=1 Tax=Comamonas badia TaxID=265291 RepID=UPI0004031E60|nr:alpha/beta hydrolase [Comamonas badia]OJU87211.1 MAG: alpha/beta hydrolase [Burkholderiales bacterium 66-5]